MAEITDPTTLSQLNTSGPEFLSQLAATHGPGYAALVKATAEGASAAPSGMAMRTPFGQQLTQDVYQFDPTADAVNLPARTAVRKAFTEGKQGQAVLSAATALEHSSNLDDAITKLGNVDPGFGLTHVVNGVRNAFRDASGNTDVTQFQNTVTPLVDELERAYTQTGGSVSAINDLRKGINLSQSMAQQREAVQTFTKLLAGKLEENNQAYNLGMGTVGQTAPGISDRAKQLMAAYSSPDYINKGLAGVLPPSNDGPPAIAPGAPPPDGGTPPPSGPAGGPAPDSPPPGLSGPSTDGSSTTLATGSTRTEHDPVASALIDKLVRSHASADQINAELAAQGLNKGIGAVSQSQVDAAQAYLKQHPNYAGSFGSVDRTVDNGIANRIAASPVGAAIVGASNAASLGLGNKIGAGVSAIGDRLAGDDRNVGDIYNANLTDANQKSELLAQANPLSTLGGETAGFLTGDALIGKGLKAVGGAIPGLAALGGKIPTALRPLAQDAAYGGAYGAGSSDHLSDVAGNTLEGAGMAALGGVLGRGLVKGGAAALSPVANGAVRRLTDAGVTLTPGQILGANGGIVGRAVKGIEDRAAGFPVVGDIINSARRGGVEDFNRASLNDALAPIGETASDIGHGGIADAQQKVSDAYTSALSKMSAVPDQQFTSDLKSVGSAVQTLSPTHRAQFNNIVDTDLQPYLNGKGKLDGNDLQAIKQGLDTRIANLKGQGSSPQDRDLADRLSDVKDAVLDLAGRTPGSDKTDFDNANRAYAMLSRVEGAAAKSKDGVFTPNQFRQAVTKRGYGTTTKNVATGSALMQQLATDASTVLPSSVPDSGTAGRGALAAVLGVHAGGAALGGGVGYEQGGKTGALAGAALGAGLFSRPGLRATQAVLAGSRGKAFNTLGDILRRNASLGGAVGTPLLLQSGSRDGN